MQIDFFATLKRCLPVFNLSVLAVKPPFDELCNFDLGLRSELNESFDWQCFGKQLLELRKDFTVILAEDILGIHYAILPLDSDAAVLVGPWRGEHQTSLSEFSNKASPISADAAAVMQSYFKTVPQIHEQTVVNCIVAFAEAAFDGHTVTVEKLVDAAAFYVPNVQKQLDQPSFWDEFPFSLIQQRCNA